jgi:hypothetical protein
MVQRVFKGLLEYQGVGLASQGCVFLVTQVQKEREERMVWTAYQDYPENVVHLVKRVAKDFLEYLEEMVLMGQKVTRVLLAFQDCLVWMVHQDILEILELKEK